MVPGKKSSLLLLEVISAATVSKGCKRDTCKNYGVCVENYLGIATCTCLQRFYGTYCEKVKRTYTAELEISSLRSGDSTWSKEYIKSMLKIGNSQISNLVQRLTVIMLNGALSSKADYLGSRILLETNKEPVALIELNDNSTLTAVEVQVILLDHLRTKQFTVQVKENNSTIEMKTDSVAVSDHNECDKTALQSCGTNADCVNTIGSFKCQCKAGSVQDGHVCKTSSVTSESKVDWNRIFIWGGIVLVVLFWMLIVGLCVRKRMGKKPDDKYRLGHSTISRKSTEAANIPEIKITETSSIYNGSSRRPSAVYVNKGLELDNISMRSASLERRLSRQHDLQKRGSVATSEYGSSSPYLDSVSNDGRFSDAQSISSADSDLTMPNYTGDFPSAPGLPRRTSDLSVSQAMSEDADRFESRRRSSFNGSIASRGSSDKQRKVNVIASMNSFTSESRRDSDDVLQLSVANLHPTLSNSSSTGSTSSTRELCPDPPSSPDMPERDY